jgi:hypothetical protein
VLALLGLGCVGGAITAAVVLVISVIDQGIAVPVIGALTLATFAGLWFALPLARRRCPLGRSGQVVANDSGPYFVYSSWQLFPSNALSP